MDIEKLTTLLKETIHQVQLKEGDYFSPVSGRERSIVFRIAHALANEIESTSDLFVDIEPNRCNLCTKRNLAGHSIIPDLIIHHRKGTGLLVVEFKTSNQSRREDYAKLELLTMNKEESKNLHRTTPTYKRGIFVRLHDSSAEYVFFENGKEIKNNLM